MPPPPPKKPFFFFETAVGMLGTVGSRGGGSKAQWGNGGGRKDEATLPMPAKMQGAGTACSEHWRQESEEPAAQAGRQAGRRGPT